MKKKDSDEPKATHEIRGVPHRTLTLYLPIEEFLRVWKLARADDRSPSWQARDLMRKGLKR